MTPHGSHGPRQYTEAEQHFLHGKAQLLASAASEGDEVLENGCAGFQSDPSNPSGIKFTHNSL